MFSKDRIGFFIAVAEAGTFSGAADKLRVSKSVVSDQIQKLEMELGVQLIIRTTRKLSLTSSGRDFLEHCYRIEELSLTAAQTLKNDSQEIAGLIRVTTSVDYGQSKVSSVLATFSALHPKIELELNVTDQTVNLIDENVDL